MIPCAGSWSLFEDPTPDENNLLDIMKQRITALDQQLGPFPVEKDDKTLLRFLRTDHHNLEGAMLKWHEWVSWRRSEFS